MELEPEIGVFGYAGIKEYIGALFAGSVDVIGCEGLNAHIRPNVTADELYAF